MRVTPWLTMDLLPRKYRATFTSLATVVTPSEHDRFIAKASIQPLKYLLPADVDPDNDPDLLYISCNGAVAGLMNKNGDAISCETAVQINSTARNKYINTDHERDRVVGVILYPGFSKFGSNEPLTTDQAKDMKEPFNMAFAGVLWKTISPMLSKYLVKVGDAVDSDALSMSWEIAFNSYDIGVGSRNLFDAQIIKETDAKFSDYDGLLRVNGGDGRDPAGKEVFRVINGDPIILGYSIVPRPAAEVKGILPIQKTQKIETKTDASTEESNSVLTAETLSYEDHSQKSEEKSITSTHTRVIPNTDITMKIENVSQIESQWTELRKLESAASIVDFVRKMEEQSAKYLKDIEEKNNVVETTKAAKQETDKKVSDLEQSIANLQKELKDVRAAAATAEAHQKFQERMAQFDSEFELTPEHHKIIAKRIRDIDTDEEFATVFAEYQVLLAAAKKSAKKDPKKKSSEKPGDNKDDKEPDDDGDDDDDVDPAKAAIKEAVASVKEDPNQTKVINTPVEVNTSLAQEIADAFGGSFKINGKPVAKKTDNK